VKLKYLCFTYSVNAIPLHTQERGDTMAKAQSVAELIEVNDEAHSLVVEVIHSDSASFRRSVLPAANKEFDKFMRSPKGQAWISAGFYRFSTDPNWGAVEGGSLVTYSVTD